MPREVTFEFDPNQDFQLQAVGAITGLFSGYPRQDERFQLGDDIVANVPSGEAFDGVWLSENVRTVQHENRLPAPGLKLESELELQGISDGSWEYPSFTVEMETGTGKTYAYLRTIHELRRLYGWRKFVIIVPSIAIYEGVIKTFDDTRAHFAALYNNEPIHIVRYDGAQLSRIRSFATSTFCEVLVVTLDSFNKSGNVIYQPSDKLAGERRPFQFIQETRPIVIMDEPQNMESAIARSAIATLHPLFSLRYSATHRTSPNLVYRLTPFEAFQRNLVKRIQVWAVTDREDHNQPFLSLKSVTRKGGIRARIGAYVLEKGQTKEKELVLRRGDDLHSRTARDEHRNGYVVAEIDASKHRLTFENGLILERGLALGPSRPELFRVQIEETIRQHFETQERLRKLGVKVLSLFFVDRVANYESEDGLIRRTFDEAFRKLSKQYEAWRNLEPTEVRAAYFAKKRTKSGDESIDIDPEKGPTNEEQRQAAKEAFKLIMRKKGQLLSFTEKTAFIFAHSALKEGWDNPNIFQICTLNQTMSKIRKRQEIGRGMRLAVNQMGQRSKDDEVNVLTVVANESYESYARELQREYIEEGDGEEAPPKPGNARQTPACRNDQLFATAQFREFWRRLSQKIAYRIKIDAPELIRACAARLASSEIPAPTIVVQKGEYVVHRFTLTLVDVRHERARIRLNTVDSRDRHTQSEEDYRAGDDLALRMGNPRLRGYKLGAVLGGAEPRAEFENKIVLYRGQPQCWESVEGQQVRRRVVNAPPVSYAIPDLVTRTSQATGLTRVTVREIFRLLPRRVQFGLIRDPEAFCGLFATTIRSVLADHIADRLECVVTAQGHREAEEMFPAEVRLAQRELVLAGAHGLYDKVQRDSGVEDTFIAKLQSDERVAFYFKFPPKFLIHLPRMIGNYNPDWGIVRRGDDGALTLYLVRETKGTVDLSRLQFPQEKRKIVCATKYFGAAAVDYRVVSDETIRWWTPSPVDAVQEELRVN